MKLLALLLLSIPLAAHLGEADFTFIGDDATTVPELPEGPPPGSPPALPGDPPDGPGPDFEFVPRPPVIWTSNGANGLAVHVLSFPAIGSTGHYAVSHDLEHWTPTGTVSHDSMLESYTLEVRNPVLRALHRSQSAP